MNLISFDSVSKTVGNKNLFNNISFGIDEGQKVALIGINGSGKTTLLNIITGKENIDSGIFSKNKETKIAYLSQLPVYEEDDTILDHIFNSNNSLASLIKEYESFCLKMENLSQNEKNRFEEVIHDMDNKNGWEYEKRIKSILNELELDDLFLKMKNLSGGMLKKVALAQCLIDDANLLIMDEPTNHLDLKTISFLQNYLEKTKKALLLVTHDRYFLDDVCNTILEIDRTILTRFEGNYSFYLEKKAEIENSLLKEDDRIENTLRKELEWYKRQPKARTTKSKSRMDSIESMMKHEKFKVGDNVEMTINGRRLGKKILEIDGITKSYDKKTVLKPYSYIFKQNEKIGIIGPNGSGKTTFLNILTGIVAPDSGTIDKGINTHFGYFTQNKENFDPNMKIIDYVKKIAESITLSDGKTITASKMLERFLFPSNMQYNTISNLSGGEKRRLYLLKILMSNPNFLIFDEPTNDLDIKTLSILENFLNDFTGCLIVVTHDRYFMNRVVDHLFVFDENGNIKSFPGNYTDYLEYEESKKADIIPETKDKPETEKTKAQINNKIKLTFKEKKELESLEKEIELLENEKKDLDEKFSSGEFDSEKIKKWTSRYDEINNKLDITLKRWEELASIESQ
ncbi:MAG TPA: ABC-F family ATP-binding cassette domain-containing protein [Spirochaetota bacterium]|nr:ABC-F family ATP-binding cassette domain-containing protein [Spirochaetota bacterium]